MEFPYACQCVECDEELLLSELKTAEEMFEDISNEDGNDVDNEDEGNVPAVVNFFCSKCRFKYL